MNEIKLDKIKSPQRLIPKGGNDCVMTPPQLAQDVVNYFQTNYQIFCDDSMIEPCRGTGSFFNAMKEIVAPQNVDWCELSEGIDFLAKDFGDKRYDWIITNPPFSKFRAFLKKSMEVADNVVFLCTINHIFGLRARLRDIKEAGFYIREALLCETPESWPSSGFAVGAVYLSRERGDCKISHL